MAGQNNICVGQSQYGKVIYNWDGTNLRQGDSKYGDVIRTLDGAIPMALIIYLLVN